MTAPLPGVERDRAAREAAPDLTPAEAATLARIEDAEPAPESLRERLGDALAAELEVLGIDGEMSARAADYLADTALRIVTEPTAAGPDQHQAADDGEVLHADLCELLNALGLGAYARPYSPHEVMQRDVIPAARSLRAHYDLARGITT